MAQSNSAKREIFLLEVFTSEPKVRKSTRRNEQQNENTESKPEVESVEEIISRQTAGEDDNYDPFSNRKVRLPTTDAETLVLLLKGVLGSGVLAMPLAFSNAGLWFGLVSCIVIGTICTYCMHIIIKCAHILCHRKRIPSMSYSDVAEHAFLEGPPALKKLSKFARFLIDLFLILNLLGCCCVYVLFVAENSKQVFEYYEYTNTKPDIKLYILVITAALILICLIIDLKYLAPLSFIANILLLISLAITMYYVVIDLPDISERPAVANFQRWPLFFGTVIYAFEAVGIIMSLENNMRNPEHLIGCPSVLNIGMAAVVILLTAVGFFGYWKYGSDIKASITLNIPVQEEVGRSVKLMIVISIFFTYALQFYVPVNVIWSYIKDKFSENMQLWMQLLLRTLLVILMSAIAYAFPDLGPLVSIIGAVCLSTLGLIFPSIIELVVYYEEPGWGRFYWILYKNLFLIVFGVIGFVTGLYTGILDLDQNMNKP